MNAGNWRFEPKKRLGAKLGQMRLSSTNSAAMDMREISMQNFRINFQMTKKFSHSNALTQFFVEANERNEVSLFIAFLSTKRNYLFSISNGALVFCLHLLIFAIFLRCSLHIIRFIYLLLRKEPFSHSFTRPIHSLLWSKFELFRTQILRTIRKANNNFDLCRIFFHLPLSKHFHNIAPNFWFCVLIRTTKMYNFFSSSIWLHAHSI